MNEEKFSQMKDGAILVNIARGAVVDTEALKREIRLYGDCRRGFAGAF